MNKFIVLFAVMLLTQAQAETEPRCGRDTFGNTVCMDKDGVLSIAPRAATDGKDKGSAASAVEAAGSGSRDSEQKVRRRCGVDPFGNNVCREW
ncbi:MAG: hypothetical protein HY799_04975 [Nitrosomonadales bacterium]|nr:hypothetical protein [Nitrosomonadales bacterium]